MLQIPLLHAFDNSSLIVSVVVPGVEDSIVSGAVDSVVLRQRFTQLILAHSLVKIKLIVLVNIIVIETSEYDIYIIVYVIKNFARSVRGHFVGGIDAPVKKLNAFPRYLNIR